MPDTHQQCYSPLKAEAELDARMLKNANDIKEDCEEQASRGCFVVLKATGTCICCVKGGGLHSVDVSAMARLTVALQAFSSR